MESAQLKLPPSPGAPLYPISPDRFNQQRMSGSPMASPEISPLHGKSGRNSADVQSRVAYFTNLSRASSPTSGASATTTAALQRAILGREEAEAALHSTQAQLSEANARERRVSERLESLMEELQSLKERQGRERAIYEKEVRKARKEAFRAGSTLVKVQEELKYARGRIQTLEDGFQAEKDAKDTAKQEAFERAYALAGLTEEMETMKERLRSAEMENRQDGLEARTEGLQITTPTKRSTTRSRSSTPVPRSLKRDKPDTVDQKSPTRKRVFSGEHILSPKAGSPIKLQPSPARRSDAAWRASQHLYEEQVIIESLKSELRFEKQLRLRAEDMVDFLKIECQFKRCSCRIAESRGAPYLHDCEWDVRHEAPQDSFPASQDQEALSNSQPTIPAIAEAGHHDTQEQVQKPPQPQQRERIEETQPEESIYPPAEEQASVIMTFCPDTGTFQSIPSPAKTSAAAQSQQVNPQEASHPSRHNSRPPSLAHQPPEHHPVETREQIVRQEEDSIPVSERPEPRILPSAPNSATESEAQYVSARQSFTKEITPVAQTTTQTVPLLPERDENKASDAVPATPVSREEALAQIRARRGRTQSALKRSASANDASTRSRAAATPVKGPKRIPGVENSAIRGQRFGLARRDISAPAGKY